MNKCSKKWLLAAAVLVIVGVLIIVGALAIIRFDFTKLSTQKFQTNIYEFAEDFDNISVNVETAEIILVPYGEELCRVECFEEEKMKHSVKIQEGKLIIDVTDNRKWYNYIGINFQTPTVKVYLPKNVYNSLSVDTVTGDIEISDKFSFETVKLNGTTSDITCYAFVSSSAEINTTTGDITFGSTKTEAVKLSATTGEITVSNVTCNNLMAKSSTGEISLKNVVAEVSIKAENTTGGVELDGCDATEITVKTSTGDVKGTLLSGKIFITDTSTGSVNVPSSTGGGKCEIKTSTGDIKIEIE